MTSKTRALALAALLCAGPAAGQETAAAADGALTTCLLRHASDADRSALVRWVFLVIAHHPDVADMVGLDARARTRVEADAAAVFQRLMTQDCAGPLATTIRRSGTDAVGQSFEVLGRTAMTRLMQDPAVQAANAAVMERVDFTRLGEVLREPGT